MPGRAQKALLPQKTKGRPGFTHPRALADANLALELRLIFLRWPAAQQSAALAAANCDEMRVIRPDEGFP
jgi:hypothetical protein